MTAAIEDFGPGHLPVIRAFCDELGIHDTLNEQLTWDESQCNLSPAHRLVALIMNVLTEFFEGTDVENLFGDDVEPEDINNHACARALDKLYEAGSNTILGTVLVRAADAEDIDCSVLHADTTSFSVHGLYELDEDAADDTLDITHGYSTDDRRDLRQFKAGLGVNRAGVPVLGEILDGNADDNTWNTEFIVHLNEWLDTDEPLIYVADSSAFTRSTIDEAADHGIDLITRVPRTYSAVDE